MGKIYTTLALTNHADQILARNGAISPEDIRTLTLSEVLVDTGATTLCLPRQIIEQLGLPLLREVSVATATGLSTARIFDDLRVRLCDREGTFDCLELPGGSDPLLGVIPLERLGIEPDLQQQTLRTLPLDRVEAHPAIVVRS